MSMAALLGNFERESATTRRHLERLPGDKFEWRPHAKSYAAGELAAHIVECLGFTASIFGSDELDVDPKTYQPLLFSSPAELLAAFDETVRSGADAMQAATDLALEQPWRLKIMGRVRFERPKEAAFLDMTLHHVIHHRGQLSVYLRLLDVPVPGSYGPTADERPGG